MIDKKTIGTLLGVCYAAVFGAIVTVGIHGYWPHMSVGVLLLSSVALFVGFYFTGRWIAVRNEQNKKLTTSVKELRRRSKEFYDWLDSQGHR
jgi:hypothetical protein